MSATISIIAGFLAGLIGSMGFGGGGILIIFLVVFANVSQITAQGINLIFFIPCAIISVIIYAFKNQIKFKEIIPVILGGIAATLPASYILNLIDTTYLSKIFAVFLILMGVISIIKIKK